MTSEKIEKIFPGPVLLLAGPGTGKTHTLALRIKFLIEEEKVDPKQITVITFTNEAAINMRERISDMEKPDVYISPENQPAFICTMHSLGQRIITENIAKINLREDFRLVSSSYLQSLLFDDCAQLLNLSREKGKEANLCRQKGKCTKDNNAQRCQICDQYRQLLTVNNAIDYNDQIMFACEILRNNGDVLDSYKQNTKYLLVDEYQDINHSQFEFIKLLCGGQEEGLFCVGDDDQSIYSFRGGSCFYIKNFNRDFSNSKTVSLDTCRRCPSNILKSSLKIVNIFSPDTLSKPVLNFTRPDGRIFVYDVPSQKKESQIISDIVRKALPSKEVLILIPHRGFSLPIKRILRSRKINYQCKVDIDDDSGFSRLDILKEWITDSNDNFALRECIQSIIDSGNFGIPTKKVRKPEKKSEREKILKTISSCWNEVISNKADYFTALKQAGENSSIVKQIVDALEELHTLAKGNASSFLKSAVDYLKLWKDPEELFNEISKLLEEISSRNMGGSGIVRILSMQKAKGLEADVVIIVGLDQRVFPKEKINKEDEEEASRLLYVSMTRAKVDLHLFHARKREASITFLPPVEGQGYSILSISPFIDGTINEYARKVYIKSEN